MGISNGRLWIPVVSIFVALSGAYITAQVSIAEKLGDKVSRSELKEAVRDTREQIQREMNDIKENQRQTNEQIQETNRLLRQLMLRKSFDDRR